MSKYKKYHCDHCEDLGWVHLRRPEFIFVGKYDEYYEQLAEKIGTIRACYAQLCDMAMPKWIPCEVCCLIYREFRDMWE